VTRFPLDKNMPYILHYLSKFQQGCRIDADIDKRLQAGAYRLFTACIRNMIICKMSISEL